MINKQEFRDSILSLPRSVKILIALLCDINICLVSVWISFYLRLDQIIFIKGPVATAAYISVSLLLPILWFSGLYRTIFRYSVSNILSVVLMSSLIYGLSFFITISMFGVSGIPRSIGIIQPMLLFFGILSSRMFTKYILGSIKNVKSSFCKTALIYGAGNAGQQLALVLESNIEFKIVGFLDDDKRKHGQILEGRPIYALDQLDEVVKSNNIELVLLALPSINRFRRNQIISRLQKHKLIIHTLPSVKDIIAGKVSVSDIRELDINDLLNRETISPKKKLLIKNIKSQVVLVTGAGGSIGSELCRQITKINPELLILCEQNEFALYKIYEELKEFEKKTKIIPLLASIQDEKKMNEILKIFKVNTIYHSAAYKHVPLVESNISASVINNVFGTLSVAKAAIAQNVSNFVLISSDKAVRPKNIMGATKRLAELCVQGLYHKYRNKKISMSIVRFGNVIDSSGSVIPKFKQQIKQGGPVTLTHPDVTRYFMTIPEAAQLVIQAGAMSNKCDVFVLDMGKSIKIIDLIYRIIDLSGLTVKDNKNPYGDIEIKIIGLRPGEKLYEELLLGDNPQVTKHKKIKKAQDPFIPYIELEKYLEKLKILINDQKIDEIKSFLEKIIDNYYSDYEIVDHFYLKQMSLRNSRAISGHNKNNQSTNIINIKKY